MFDLLEWYSFLKGTRTSALRLPYYFYSHVTRPIVAFLILVISLISHVLNYRAYAAINTGIEMQDVVCVNKGFKNIYVVFLLGVISFSLAIFSICYRYFMLTPSTGI
jgi:hypothetical protein